MAEMLSKDKYVMYRGKPLVRSGGQYMYGWMDDTHSLFIGVMGTEKVGDSDIPSNVTVMVRSKEDGKIVKAANKKGFYEALDVGIAWLDLALKGKLA